MTTTESSRAAVLELLDHFATGDLPAAFALLADDFISHNPRVPHDPATTTARQAFIDFFTTPAGQALATATQQVHRVIADDTLVAVHTRLTSPHLPETAVVDILRVHNGRIAEHWDVVQPVPSPIPHPHGMF
ncbi:nuclear transport factor 2 family protein [Nocardia sp. CA-136227]|uniref:nuclear transport factor 2 family protein n=1 Tax=Nocardia sp. CA-136227 TaxID=3239979 RepID=UPI003D97C1CD